MAKTEKQLAEELIAIAKQLQPKFKISNGKLSDTNGTFTLSMFPRNTVSESTISYK